MGLRLWKINKKRSSVIKITIIILNNKIVRIIIMAITVYKYNIYIYF